MYNQCIFYKKHIQMQDILQLCALFCCPTINWTNFRLFGIMGFHTNLCLTEKKTSTFCSKPPERTLIHTKTYWTVYALTHLKCRKRTALPVYKTANWFMSTLGSCRFQVFLLTFYRIGILEKGGETSVLNALSRIAIFMLNPWFRKQIKSWIITNITLACANIYNNICASRIHNQDILNLIESSTW